MGEPDEIHGSSHAPLRREKARRTLCGQEPSKVIQRYIRLQHVGKGEAASSGGGCREPGHQRPLEQHPAANLPLTTRPDIPRREGEVRCAFVGQTFERRALDHLVGLNKEKRTIKVSSTTNTHTHA